MPGQWPRYSSLDVYSPQQDLRAHHFCVRRCPEPADALEPWFGPREGETLRPIAPWSATIAEAHSRLSQRLSRTVVGRIVSAARSEEGRRWIQSDVSIHPRNSGGPLVDPAGRVVGIAQSGVEVRRASRCRPKQLRRGRGRSDGARDLTRDQELSASPSCLGVVAA